MTHTPTFQPEAGRKNACRYRTERLRQQGKGIARNGMAGGSLRQNPGTERTANRLDGVGEKAEQAWMREA
jgi:hypothetical protein